jgi:Swt1-like HEPN
MGINDDINQAWKLQELARRASDPLMEVRRLAEESVTAQLLRHEEERRRQLLGIGPDYKLRTSDRLGLENLTHDWSGKHRLFSSVIDDLRTASATDSALTKETLSAITAYKQYEEMFRRPAFDETERLVREAMTASAWSKLADAQTRLPTLTSAIDSIRSPWLNADHEIASVRGLTDLLAMAHAINTRPPFDSLVTTTLRESLGDWRSVSVFPPAIFDSPAVRSDFYADLGFDLALTDFPAPAFDESLAIAGFRNLQDEPDEEADDDEGLARTTAAREHLVRFERLLRRFIDARMTAQFGPNWVRQQVPGALLTAWREKKAKATGTGEQEESLLAYAEFADYVQIIERNDNWIKVFEPVFGRREDVKESFVRLFPVRNCAMHARIITFDDEVYMHSETLRVLRAIERSK